MTATVTAGGGPSAEGYRRFFSEPAGRDALSTGGSGAELTVERMTTANDGSFRVTVTEPDTQGQRATLVDERSWRAFFTVNDHLVAVSLRSPREAPLSSQRANALLNGLVAEIRKRSAAAAPPAAEQS